MDEQTAANTHDQGLREPRDPGAEATESTSRRESLRESELYAGGAAHASRELQHREAALADELALHQRVHEISCRLIPADDVQTIYRELVDAAIDLAGAGGGTMQVVDQVTGELLLLEARGIPEKLLRRAERVAPDSLTSCALALRGSERVVVDYQTDERVARSPDAIAHLDAGIRAAQSTPLLSRSGEVVGMLSTHWNEPHVLPEHRARLLDIIARQAADLIERLRSDEALRQSEKHLRIATTAAGVGLHDFDVQSGTVQWDERTRELWGVEPDEPITYELWRDSLHPDDLDAAEGAVGRALEPDGDGRYVAEYRVTNRRDGQERWVLALGQTTFVDGVPVRLVGTAQEITERKRAEEELRESRERLRLALEAGRLGNWHLDLVTGEASTSLRHDQCFGAPEPFEEWSYEIFMSYVHPDDRAEVRRRFDEALATRDGWHSECRVIWPDGSVHWIEAHGMLHFDAQDQPRSMLGVVQDITERKNTEEQLRRNHETFFHLVANSPFGVYIVDSEFRLRQISQGARKVFEQVRPLIGRDFADVLRHIWEEPFASEAIARFRHTLQTGEPYIAVDTTERRHDIPEVESYDWRIERITLPDGEYGVVCYFYDLSEIKRAEAELRHRGEQLETLIDQAPLGVYLLDADLRIAHVNPVARPVFGDVTELVGRDFEERIVAIWGDERGEELMAIFRHTLETGESYHVPEFGEHRQDRGLTEYYDWRTDRIMLPDGRYGVVCYFHDISDQVSARDAIARSEAKYRTLFESIDEGFCVLEMIFDGDRAVDYRFVETNPAFERQTGLTDAIGKTARELVPDLEEHWFEIYGDIARTGEPRRFVNYAEGLEARWFDVYGFRLRDHGSSLVALLFKDITQERRTLQELEELTRTLEERVDQRTREVRHLASTLTMAEQEERRRIARVLHDGLQQLLFAVQLRLEAVAAEAATTTSGAGLANDLQEPRAWLGQAIDDTRQLSIELSPPVLKSDGLAGALRWLAGQMQEKHGLEVSLQIEPELPVADDDLSSLLFQCTRELLFNVVKHAGVAEAIVSADVVDSRIRIVVRDEGAGFEAGTSTPSNDGGFGLAHMSQRLVLIGGSFEVDSAPGRGTRAHIGVPLRGRS